MTLQEWHRLAELAARWIRDAEAAGNLVEAARLRTVLWQKYETITRNEAW